MVENMAIYLEVKEAHQMVLLYEIDLVPTYILFLNIICIYTIHRYQPYYDYGVRWNYNKVLPSTIYWVCWNIAHMLSYTIIEHCGLLLRSLIKFYNIIIYQVSYIESVGIQSTHFYTLS